jgi:hypothetical protein
MSPGIFPILHTGWGLYPDSLLKTRAGMIHRGRRWIMRFDLGDEEWALLEPLMRKVRGARALTIERT